MWQAIPRRGLIVLIDLVDWLNFESCRVRSEMCLGYRWLSGGWALLKVRWVFRPCSFCGLFVQSWKGESDKLRDGNLKISKCLLLARSFCRTESCVLLFGLVTDSLQIHRNARSVSQTSLELSHCVSRLEMLSIYKMLSIPLNMCSCIFKYTLFMTYNWTIYNTQTHYIYTISGTCVPHIFACVHLYENWFAAFLSSLVLTSGCWSHQGLWFSSLWKSCCCLGAEKGCTSLNLVPQRQVLFLWRKLWWTLEKLENCSQRNMSSKTLEFLSLSVFLDFSLLKSTWMLATNIDATAQSEAGFQWWSSPWRDAEVFLACSTLMHLGWICSWPVWLVTPTVWNLMWNLPCCSTKDGELFPVWFSDQWPTGETRNGQGFARWAVGLGC